MKLNKFIVFLNSEFSCNLLNEIGGKAINILRLSQYNLNVPSGFVITNSLLNYVLEYNKILKKIKEMVAKINFDNIVNIFNMLKHEIISMRIPENIINIVKKALKDAKLDKINVSIRSSGISEDLRKYSFAGLYDSFINIPVEEIMTYIKLCWASQFNPQVLAYRLMKNLPLFEGMGVIVQETICGDVSGVMFTQNLDRKDELLIEANFGLGISVVKGEVTPDQYVVSRKKLKVLRKVLGQKDLKYVCADIGVKRVETSVNERNNFCLDDEMLIKLAKIGLKIEQIFGAPQDIEWTIKDNTIYILQSRFITT